MGNEFCWRQTVNWFRYLFHQNQFNFIFNTVKIRDNRNLDMNYTKSDAWIKLLFLRIYMNEKSELKCFEWKNPTALILLEVMLNRRRRILFLFKSIFINGEQNSYAQIHQLLCNRNTVVKKMQVFSTVIDVIGYRTIDVL